MGKRLQLTGASKAVFAAVQQAMAQNRLPSQIQTTIGTAEIGVSGTTIWAGDVQSESNVELIYQLAYGRAGSRVWGQWEKAFRTDESVAKSIEFTKAQIRDARVDVTEPSEDDQPDRKAAKVQTDFVRWNLMNALDPGWSETAQQMTGSMLVNGFSLHEVVMAQCKHRLLPGGTGYRIAKLAERLPSSIQPNGWIEKNGELVSIKQWGPKDGAWLQPTLPSDKVLLATWNRNGNNYLGFSAFRSVWYLVKIREHLLKVLAIGAVRESVGVPTATMDKGVQLTPKSRKALQKFLGNMVYHENASVVLPPGVKLDFLYSPGANKGHLVEAWEKLGVHIQGQVQAQQMSLGTNGTGSRAVGQVHDASADAFALGVIANITRVINGSGYSNNEDGMQETCPPRPYEGLIRKLVDANFGPQPAYPTFTMVPRQAKLGPTDFATAAAAMKTGGLITVWTIDDENTAREKLGLGAVDEDDFEDAKQTKADAATAMQQALAKQPAPLAPGQKPPPGVKPANEDEEEPQTSAPKKLKASAAFTPRRPLRASEQNLALGEMQDFLDGGKDKFEKGVKPIVAGMLASALPDVRSAMKDGRIDNGEMSRVKLNTARLEKFIGSFLSDCRDEGYRHVGMEYTKSAKAHAMKGASEEEDDFNPPDPTPPEPSTKEQQLLTAQRKQLANRMASRLKDQLEQTAIDVLRTGGEPEEVIGDVMKDSVEGNTFKGDAGSVMTRAFNMGRQEFANKYSDDIDSAELSSVLDDGTCDYCESMDGTELDFGSANEASLTPPLRDCEGRGRCRCIKVFNFKKPGFGPAKDDDDE